MGGIPPGTAPTVLLSTAPVPVLRKPYNHCEEAPEVLRAKGTCTNSKAALSLLPSPAVGSCPVTRKEVLYFEKLSGSHRNQAPEQDLSPRKAGSMPERVSKDCYVALQLIQRERNVKDLPPSLRVCFEKLRLREHLPGWFLKCRAALTCHL